MGHLHGLRVCYNRRILPASLILLALASTCLGIGEIIYAVNCGGNAHVDVYGIHYQRDPLTIGTSSEHGKVLTIRRVFPQDQILYQTERYHTDNFEYSVPIKSDGDYVLVMKFSEVWFTESNRKVFSVQLNEQHLVVDNLDIFAAVGLGVAHDEVVPFAVKNGQLHVNKETSDFDGFLNIEFVKLQMDNPKINAIFVMKGTLKDVPMLPPLPSPSNQGSDDEDEEEVQEKSQQSHRKRRPVSEVKVSDPYAAEDPSSMLLPVIIAIAAFVPIVFCLCKL